MGCDPLKAASQERSLQERIEALTAILCTEVAYEKQRPNRGKAWQKKFCGGRIQSCITALSFLEIDTAHRSW